MMQIKISATRAALIVASPAFCVPATWRGQTIRLNAPRSPHGSLRWRSSCGWAA
jgi:hypothetical protein